LEYLSMNNLADSHLPAATSRGVLRRLRMLIAAVLPLGVAVSALPNGLTMPSVFGDGMVLQRDTAVPVWGMATPGEPITVSFGGQRKRTVADDRGRWRVELEPMPAQTQPRDLEVRGQTSHTFHDVRVGEVWIASGQSNMEWPLRETDRAGAALARSADPELRLYTGRRTVGDEPAFDNPGQWEESSSTAAAGFSAVAYHFGRRLRDTLDVPVGLIHISWGGTPAEAWMSKETLSSRAELQPMLERFEASKAGHDERQAAWEAVRDAWIATPEAERGPWPEQPFGPGHKNQPAGLYHGMVTPLVPFAARGVVWYQGESNVVRAEQYRTLFPALIRDWRDLWGNPDWPFLFVQLANIGAPAARPVESDWAELRDAQRYALNMVPRTGMAVAHDIGDADDVHPRNKADVGDRLARWALVEIYGREGVAKSGPLFEDVRFEPGRAVVRFETFGGGLRSRDGGPIGGFTLAGEDRVFHPARVLTVHGDTLTVASATVPKPVAVRYAWSHNPTDANLVGADDLPASLFRSDDWPGVTAGRR
jgi:sialate O-acetylesterase